MWHDVEKMKLKVFALMLCMSICSASNGRCFKPAMFQRISLVHLTGGSVLKTLTKDHILSCQLACTQMAECKSINVRERTDGYFDCDLLSENKDTSGRELKPTQGSTYYEVSVDSFIDVTVRSVNFGVCFNHKQGGLFRIWHGGRGGRFQTPTSVTSLFEGQ